MSPSEDSIPVITVDGGAACGKGAVAHRLAQKLGFHYLDSGVYYRALGLRALLHGASANSAEDEDRLIALAENLSLTFRDEKIFLHDTAITQGKTQGTIIVPIKSPQNSAPINVPLILDDGLIEITTAIRTEYASVMSSKVSMWGGVRAALMNAQRRANQPPGLVAEGRDMGTVVFPQARLKFFMVCDLEVRAKRRLKQLENQGVSAKISDLRESLSERDKRDTTRAVAPLKPAPDAIMVDNTHHPLDEVVAQCLEHIRTKTGLMPRS